MKEQDGVLYVLLQVETVVWSEQSLPVRKMALIVAPYRLSSSE